jgi:SRSO17 transposase
MGSSAVGSISDPADMAFYVTFAPDTTELKELAAVAGLRWTIEECFQSAKERPGLIIVKRVVGTVGTVT